MPGVPVVLRPSGPLQRAISMFNKSPLKVLRPCLFRGPPKSTKRCPKDVPEMSRIAGDISGTTFPQLFDKNGGFTRAEVGGGFAAAHFCVCRGPIFVKKLWKSCPGDAPGNPGHLRDIFGTSFLILSRAAEKAGPEDFQRTFIGSGNSSL